ncbi:hypothetical protein NliqN6_2759 [Naganishia liquefaciens]|uniref:Uncharacterized protein n=1 Tax=Naganishia liquefaciens TaxID=104408 RepID=A0A8H3TSF6_9TREE|nr:hypothetical protein NliqN6_2759 [Naganishia liquefaciens]
MCFSALPKLRIDEHRVQLKDTLDLSITTEGLKVRVRRKHQEDLFEDLELPIEDPIRFGQCLGIKDGQAVAGLRLDGEVDERVRREW